MGVQLLLSQHPGAMRLYKKRKELRAGMTRIYGHQWRTTPKVDRMWLADTTAYWVDRPVMKGHIGAGPEGRMETPETATQRRFSGGAFTWWTAMTGAERSALIARVVAEDAPLREQGQAAAAKGPPKKEPLPCQECGRRPARSRERCSSCYGRWLYQSKKKGPR